MVKGISVFQKCFNFKMNVLKRNLLTRFIENGAKTEDFHLDSVNQNPHDHRVNPN